MRAGILIIGSLLWDNGRVRNEWRQSHLDMDHAEKVRTPIRYGRRSCSRGCTFTMTFAIDDQLGHGVLVPCRTPLLNADALFAEAEALWKAEQPRAAPGTIAASWGCVGVRFRAQAAPDKWTRAWAKYFSDRNTSPISPVGNDGLLRIPWPVKVCDGEEADLDLILATATEADKQRPHPKDIADAWSNQDAGNEHYFFENIRNGIRTSEDQLIWQHIEKSNAPWLSKCISEYANAVAVLRRKERDEN